MKHHTSETGVIDLIRNPFAGNNDWINQSYGLTSKRQEQLIELLGRDIEGISSIRPVNYGKYVAFVAIRWGFAEISERKLLPTKKWENRQKLDEFGQ